MKSCPIIHPINQSEQTSQSRVFKSFTEVSRGSTLMNSLSISDAPSGGYVVGVPSGSGGGGAGVSPSHPPSGRKYLYIHTSSSTWKLPFVVHNIMTPKNPSISIPNLGGEFPKS